MSARILHTSSTSLQKFFLALLVIGSSTGCTPQLVIDPPGLVNAGILPLSTENAYVGANVFIAREMERSSYLYNFIKANGAPDAIEIEEFSFEPTKVFLFYQKQNSVYSMVAKMQTELTRQWVINGPYQMNWKDIKELKKVVRENHRPMLVVWGKNMAIGEPEPEAPVRVVRPVVPPPPPPPKPKKKPVVVKKVIKTPEQEKEDALLTTDPTKFKPLNTDQQAILISKGYAERAENGDVIHTVRMPTENFEAIAKWYTGTAANAESIASTNGKTKADALSAGTSIRIPIKQLKQVKAMPADYR